jgi:DNA polymerase-1
MNILKGDRESNIDFIEFTKEEIEMCDITVEDGHCYYANGILTHNCGQEIKLAGVITGEDNFIRPFREGKDVHTEMAKKLFGEANYDKSKRKAAKVANFGLLYGGNWVILQQVGRQQGVDLTDEEAQDLFNRWWSANTTLKAWKSIQIDKTTKENNFTVKDLFGRPRRVKYYLQSEDRGLYNFGVRTICSHKVQGTGASIMRNLMVNLHKKIFSHPVYSKHVKYISSVHDEVNYQIKKEKFTQWVKVIEDMMIFNPPGFPIPIDCSIEVGNSLGSLFAFTWEDSTRTKLIPKMI